MTGGASRLRSRALRVSLAIAAGLMFAGFFALGTWQIFRLQWKLALIERVQQRIHAAPVAAPSASRWSQLNPEADDYRRVQLRGHYLQGVDTQVLASLESGIGYWIMTPLCTDTGDLVMINRGFIRAGSGGWAPQPAPPPAPVQPCATAAASDAAVTVSGLLRLTEVGARLRANEPERNFWYTRDVQAIARARSLPVVAPYFVDADGDPAGRAPAGTPQGGLTVVAFVNNHLVYALTWYVLALMVAGASVWVVRDARQPRQRS